jgi:hypothetical protein
MYKLPFQIEKAHYSDPHYNHDEDHGHIQSEAIPNGQRRDVIPNPSPEPELNNSSASYY